MISKERAISVVNDFSKKYLQSQNLTLLTITSKIPEHWGKGVKACYFSYEKSIHLFLKGIKDEKDLIETIQHEVFGHYGLNTLDNNQKLTLLTSILKSKEEPSLSKHWKTVNENYPELSGLRKAEEVFAVIAEKTPSSPVIVPLKHRKISLDTPPITEEMVRIITKSISNGLIQNKITQNIFPPDNYSQFSENKKHKPTPIKPKL